ncbi:MAG: serine hydrolase, partial [Gammaproteobacteria bacterium]
AFVVLHEGKLIAERYAPGYGPNTPIWAHSLSKSLTNALIGVLVRQGKLRVDQPLAGAGWPASDPRSAITIDQLLRMISGLPFDDNDDAINPLTHMLFLDRDMAGYAAMLPLANAPGKTWGYSNAGFMLLSRLVRDAAGESAADTERFVRRELFEPLGMRGATLDCDAIGTPVGASNSYASARDWARFGQLYLDDGMVDGRRILPEGWVAYSHSQTLDTGYGAGFWTNLVDHGSVPVWDAPWGMPTLPKDMFYARGALGQYIVIVPSERLVVVRMGFAYGGVEKAIAEIIQ